MNEIDEHGFLDVTLEDWRNIHIGHTDKLIDGATLNNLLRSQFIIFSNCAALRSTLPHGIECWSELCEIILIMLHSLCTVQQIFRRIFVLFLRSLIQNSSSSNPRYQKTDKDLAYGALEFMKIWFEHFRSFIPYSNILEMSILLEEYVEYINSIGFTRENLKQGGIGIHGVEKLYELFDLIKSHALSSHFKSLNIKQKFLKGTWNSEEEKQSKVTSNKKAGKDDKKKVAGSLNSQNKSKPSTNTNQPVINVFGVTADMLDDDDDASWDLPPPPLLLTSHLQSQQDTPNEEEEAMNPDKYFPIPRIPLGTSLLQDTFQHDLFSFDLLEIARQWTLIDHQNFLSISLASYYNCEWSLPRHQQSYLTLPIRSFIDQFNSQSCWITESLILINNTEKRLQLYVKFIELAGYLEGLNNFNGVMAILTALQQGCITRLKEMMKLVDDKTMKQLQRLQTLMSGLKNYQQYREVITLRSAALSSDFEDWSYNNYMSQSEKEGSSRRRPGSQGHIKVIPDGVSAIVPHLGAHLAELTAISGRQPNFSFLISSLTTPNILEGNSTYLSDAPHLLNLEKKRLFSRCLSQLRRLHGMSYSLHPIPLIQAVLLREYKKGRHLSAQESSEWSRRMYQCSLKLDLKAAADEETTVEENEESQPLFSRPTLTKAKSLLGGSWSSNRMRSESAPPLTELPLTIDTSTPPPPSKPPLVPSRSSQITSSSIPSSGEPSIRRQLSVQSNIHDTGATATTTATAAATSGIINTYTPFSPSPSSSSSAPVPAQVSASDMPGAVEGEKKKKGFKKLLNAMKFKKKSSNSSNPSDSESQSVSSIQGAAHEPQTQQHLHGNTTPQGRIQNQNGNVAMKDSRKMIL